MQLTPAPLIGGAGKNETLCCSTLICSAAHYYAVPRRLPKGILVAKEVEAIFHQAMLHGEKGIRDRAILEAYYATGIRRAELRKLMLDDVDIDTHLLRIDQAKGKIDRVVPIAKRACDWIARYVEQIRPQLLTLKSGSALFINDRGEAFADSQLTALVSKYVRRAGVDKPGACNLYRHTTATAMLENGADIRFIQELLGHADISTTQVYAHVSIGKLHEVYSKTHPAAMADEV